MGSPLLYYNSSDPKLSEQPEFEVTDPAPEFYLSPEDCTTLLRIARKAIQAATRGILPETLQLEEMTPDLQQSKTTFVTLTIDGNLRGCIGALQASHPLALDVQKHAVAAALEDPRFPPVGPDEVEQLSIEISVLSTPQPLVYSDPEELIENLTPGKDGVIIQTGFHRGTFLPQVWERAPDPELFLEMLCTKAQLPNDAWRKQPLEVQTYRVFSFHESD